MNQENSQTIKQNEFHPKNFIPDLIGLANQLVPQPGKSLKQTQSEPKLEDCLKAARILKDSVIYLKSGGIKEKELDFFYEWINLCYSKARVLCNQDGQLLNENESNSSEVNWLKPSPKINIEGDFQPFTKQEISFLNPPPILSNPSKQFEKPTRIARNKRKVSNLSHANSGSMVTPSVSSNLPPRLKIDPTAGNRLSKLSESSSPGQGTGRSNSGNKAFIPPTKSQHSSFNKSPKEIYDKDLEEAKEIAKNFNMNPPASKLTMPRTAKAQEEPEDERLRNLDPNMIQMIRNEIMGTDLNITWDDIAGLTHAKKTMNEIIVQPIKRPDLFRGLTAPPKGLLLFGPPGTGKTLIGKCIASESKATFFSISASTLTSKWVGEGEKMMRALFAVARCHQPAVVFLDEVDSLLTSRSEGENEASRRIKTEFLVQFEGVGTTFDEDRILIIGATNRPQEIDEAARRRFRKRLYIPLPDFEGRLSLIKRALRQERNTMSDDDFKKVAEKTEGYSGSDLYGLCQEAAFVPLRNVADISSIAKEDVEPISISSFDVALTQIRKSVATSELKHYESWNQEFGSMA